MDDGVFGGGPAVGGRFVLAEPREAGRDALDLDVENLLGGVEQRDFAAEGGGHDARWDVGVEGGVDLPGLKGAGGVKGRRGSVVCEDVAECDQRECDVHGDEEGSVAWKPRSPWAKLAQAADAAGAPLGFWREVGEAGSAEGALIASFISSWRLSHASSLALRRRALAYSIAVAWLSTARIPMNS